jgi:hypothetical protein
LLFNFVFEYAIPQLNETHQPLVCADDIKILVENINTIKRKMEVLLEASKEVGLEVNAEKDKYIVVSCHQNSKQSHNLLIDNKSFENVAKFEYFVTSVTNRNCNHE